MRMFDLMDMRHHCTGTVFQLSSFSADVQILYLFKIEHIHTFLLSKASFYAIIIRIGDDKILTGTPTQDITTMRASTMENLKDYFKENF